MDFVSAIDDLLSELRACVTDKQDAPYLRAPELALLVGYIDGLESEVRNVTYDRDGAQAEVRRMEAVERRAQAIRDVEIHSVFDQGARSAAIEILTGGAS